MQITATLDDPATVSPIYACGEMHPRSVYTDAQVALAKRLLLDAQSTVVLARGQLREIAKKTGIPRSSLLHIRYGTGWKHVEPAPSTIEVETAQ